MPQFPNHFFDRLNSWLGTRDLHDLVDIELTTFRAHPTAATFGSLYARLAEVGAVDRTFDREIMEHWEKYREVVDGTTARAAQTISPSLEMLYETRRLDDSGSEFVAVAPADASDIPFRSFEVDMVADLLGDHQIVIVTGYPGEDMEDFFTPQLVSSTRLEKSYPQRTAYKKSTAKKIMGLFMQGTYPDLLFLEAHERMDQDHMLIDALRNGFLLDENRRLVILYPHGAIPNRDAVRRFRPFIEWILKDGEYSIPVLGLVPKLLNIHQAAMYLFGQATPGYLGAARLIGSHMPLMPQFLIPLKKELLAGKEHAQIEEIVRKVAEAAGIKTPEERGAIAVLLSSEICNFSRTDTDWFTSEGEGYIRRPENGYEIFNLGPASQSPVNGSAGGAARRMRRGAGSVHGLASLRPSAVRQRGIRRRGAHRRPALGLRAARRVITA